MLIKTLVIFFLKSLPIQLQCRIHALWSRASVKVGRGSYVHSSVHVLGKENIRIGTNSCVSEGGWFNVNHRENGKCAIEIGSNCFIGKQNFFTSGGLISIGDYTLTTIGCKFIGSTHEISNPNVPYLTTGTTNDSQIIIGVNCFFGAGATVLGNVRVGHGSVIGADSLVLKDVPPFSIVVGSPARVLKRYSFAAKAWLPVSKILFEDELCLPNEKEYLMQLIASHPAPLMPWIAAGKNMGDL